MKKTIIATLLIAFACLADYSEQQAIQIAHNEVITMASFDTTDGWTDQTIISSTQPIYIDGIEGISYYECKATTNGVDAGYVLVNVNQTDLPITESSPSGKTITEMYQERLGHANFDLVRYDWSKTVAVERVQNRSGAITVTESSILENCGFVGAESGTRSADNSVAYAEIQKFQSLIALRGCNPMYSKAALDEMYEEEEQFTESQTRGGFDTEFTEETSKLQNKMVHGRATPDWSQHLITYTPEKYVGCTNTAWATLYAYFKCFLGAEFLMPGFDLTKLSALERAPFLARDCMDECYEYNNTYHKDDDDLGWTKTTDAPNAIKYAQKYGYPNATSGLVRYTSSYRLFNVIHREVSKNKPVILLCKLKYQDNFPGEEDEYPLPHALVVEATFKNRHRRVLGKLKGPWIDRDVKYKVNLGLSGSSNERIWIYFRDFHTNTHTVHTKDDAVIVDIPTSNVIVPTPPPVKMIESEFVYNSSYVDISWQPMWLPTIPITHYRVEVLENGIWVERARTSNTTYRFTGEYGNSTTYRICSERVSTVNPSNYAISSYYEGNIKFADYDNKEDLTWYLGRDEQDLLGGWTSPNNFFEKTTYGLGLLYGNTIGSDYGATVIEKELDTREKEVSKVANTLIITKRSDPEEYFNFRHGSYILIEREGLESISLYLNDNDNGFYISQQNGPDIPGVHTVKDLGNYTYEHTIDLTPLKLDGQVITDIRIVEAYNAPDDLYAMEMNSREYCKIELVRIEKAPSVVLNRLTPQTIHTAGTIEIEVGTNSGGLVKNYITSVSKLVGSSWSKQCTHGAVKSVTRLTHDFPDRGLYRFEVTPIGVDGNNQATQYFELIVEEPVPDVNFVVTNWPRFTGDKIDISFGENSGGAVTGYTSIVTNTETNTQIINEHPDLQCQNLSYLMSQPGTYELKIVAHGVDYEQVFEKNFTVIEKFVYEISHTPLEVFIRDSITINTTVHSGDLQQIEFYYFDGSNQMGKVDEDNPITVYCNEVGVYDLKIRYYSMGLDEYCDDQIFQIMVKPRPDMTPINMLLLD